MIRRLRVRKALIRLGSVVAVVFLPAVALAGGEEGRDLIDSEHAVIGNIAICMVAACGLGLLMKLLRQPPLLGYLIAGVLIGPVGLGLITDHSAIVTIAEIGLILLLFMIGLEIDLKQMLAAGKWIIVPGLLQFPICVGLGYLVFGLLENVGIDLGVGSYARLYVALAISISSTMIVVKLLFDKMELDTLPGRITLGILVFQDIWAIIVLAVQPNFNNPEILGIARTFGAGVALVFTVLALSRYVLPHIFKMVAQVPELMLILSLGWCFGVALVAAHPMVGLSMEMGALIAGVSLATYPYSLDVVAKAVSIRDFFITLFFVALGMQIPIPTPTVLLTAGAVVIVALAVRGVGIFAVLYSTKAGHRTSLLATINLSQISEFSLVIVTLGIDFGHIETDTLTTIIWVFSALAVSSTYAVTYSHPLQRGVSRVLEAVGIRDIGRSKEGETAVEGKSIALLGFFRIASAFLADVTTRHPHLLKELRVIDFNPQVKQRLDELGIACHYGDISHYDTLHHAAIHEARMVLCTIPDAFLKGTSNSKLLKLLKRLCPHAKIIVTAETVSQALKLYEEGAAYVLHSSMAAGEMLASVVDQAEKGDIADLRAAEIKDLSAREELLV
ncbi:MAG: cation:proton antiporter [Myxococcota bacterium]